MERNAVFGWLRGGKASADPVGGSNAAEAVTPAIFPAPHVPRRVIPITPVMWLPDQAPPMADLASLAAGSFELCSPTPAAAAIHLVRLPPDAVVYGGGHFIAASGGWFVKEQMPYCLDHDHAAVDALAPLDLPVIEIVDEVLLAGRHDLGRWQAWLTALLPAIVLAERAFPGRFRLLLPPELEQDDGAVPWQAMTRSLEACGIGRSRILVADPAATFRCRALFAVQPVWSATGPHPEATEALRQACSHILPSAGPIVTDTEDGLGFVERVGAFKGAERVHVFGGTAPAELIFAPSGVQVFATLVDPREAALLDALVRDRKGLTLPPHDPTNEASEAGL